MAVRTIKTRLELAGDQEYRDKLKKANTELAEQRSKLKLLTEEYKNNQNSQEALSKKITQLQEVQKAQINVVEKAREGLLNATKEQGKYAAEVEEASGKLQAAQVELEQLNTSTEEGSKRQEELTEEIRKYQTQLEKAQENQEIATQGVEDWAVKHTKAQTALNNTSAQIVRYEGYLEEAKNNTDQCATSIDEYGKRVRDTSSQQKDYNENLNRSSAAIGSLAAAITASGLTRSFKEIADAINECVQAYEESETSLAKVSTIANTRAVSMDTIKEEIMQLSNETGQAAGDLSEATYNAISASVDTADAVGFVSQATKLAVGGFTDNTTAVDILTTAINAYGMEVEQAETVSDYLITTQNLGKTTVSELASSMGRVIPIAVAYQVEMSNLSTAIAILTSRGVATAESVTYLKSMLNELGDSGSTVSKTLLDKTGMSFSELMRQGNSLGDVMEYLGDAVDNDEGAFGELWSSSEAGTAALSLLASGADHYNEVLGEMEESAGATEEAYGKMADTMEMKQQKLENAFKNLKIAVGSELKEQMEGVYEKGTDLTTWATEFLQENEWLIPVLEGVATGIGALVIEITSFTLITQVIIPLWQSFTAALAANPIGLVAAAVGVLVAALAPLIANMMNATDEVEKQAEAWKDQAAAVRESVDAYREQNTEIVQATQDNHKLIASLVELLSKEQKSAAEKAAIADITERLNEEIPDLALEYDDLSDSVNMTTEELNRTAKALEQQEKYENAAANYADIYAQNQDAAEALADAQEALTDATERYNEQLEGLDVNTRNNSSYMEEAQREVNACQEAVEDLERAVSESSGTLAAMQYDINMYTIETANMTEAERKDIDAKLEKAEAMKGYLPKYYEEIEAIAQTAQGYDDYADAVKAHTETILQKIADLQEQYQESYQTAYENIENQIGLFNEMEVGTSQSIDEMIESLESQVSYMDEYAENIKLAMDYGVDQGIISKLSDGSTESAAILREIVQSGEEKITELNQKFEKVNEGKEAFSDAIAEMEVCYGEDMDKLVADTEQAVRDMAKYDDAYQAAVHTCDGIVDGIKSQWDRVLGMYNALGSASMPSYNAGTDAHSPSRKFIKAAKMTTDGILVGIAQNRGDVLKSYEQMARESVEAYNTEIQQMEGMEPQITMAVREPVVVRELLQNPAAGGSLSGNIDTMYRDVAQASQERKELERDMQGRIEEIQAILQQYLPGMSNMQMITDTGVLVGELAPAMDEALGKRMGRKERG